MILNNKSLTFFWEVGLFLWGGWINGSELLAGL